MSRSRTIGWVLLIAAVAALGYFGWQRYRSGDTRRADRRPKGAPARIAVPVKIAPVEKADFPVYLTGLGTVQGFNTVVVRTRVDGQINRIAFKEGQFVKAGRYAGRDRSAAVPGSARSGQGQEGAGRSQSRQRQSRPAALHQARRIRDPAADRYAALHRRAIDRADRGRRRAPIDNAQTQLRLRHRQGADLGRRRPAPGRRRQYRQCRDADRHRDASPRSSRSR